ncbi:MAG: dihydrofolate reductase [Propioniciclava sp.]
MTRFIGIAIVASNGVLGDGTRQPFEFAEDWARYQRVTLGHPMIMGRATHEAIGRWLPGRTTIVVTREPAAVALPTDGRADARAVDSLTGALALAARLDQEVYVAGGGMIYRGTWPYLTDLDLTEVHASAEGSVTLPSVDPANWREVRREPRDQFDFVGYQRIGAARPLPPERRAEVLTSG